MDSTGHKRGTHKEFQLHSGTEGAEGRTGKKLQGGFISMNTDTEQVGMLSNSLKKGLTKLRSKKLQASQARD